MALHLNFEPHSWYKGFAIKKPFYEMVDEDGYRDDLNGSNHLMWYAYIDNGNTYKIDEIKAKTLKKLKQLITEYKG